MDGGADIARALGQIVGQTKSAQAAIVADARQGTRARGALEQEEVRANNTAANVKLQQSKRAETEATKAKRDEAKFRQALDLEGQRHANSMELERTKSSLTESRKRTAAAEAEEKKKQEESRKTLTFTQMVEQERTRIVEGESRKRAQAVAAAQLSAQGTQLQYRSQWAQVSFDPIRAARSAITGINGEIQSERHRDASIERTLGLAAYQAGGGRTDVQSMRRQLGAFAASEGMDASELANALKSSQDTFSVLGDRNTNAADRQSNFQNFLNTARTARNVGVDVGEFSNLQGMLQSQHLDQATQQRMLMFAAGASQRGSVEVRALVSQAMPSLMRRMGAAAADLGPGATNAQRGEAAQNAFMEAYSELQVARGDQGVSPTMAGNALANMTTALHGNVVQQKMLTNIQSAHGLTSEQRSGLIAALYNTDSHGARTLRSTNAVDVMSAIQGVHGLNADATLFGNIFAGGGHGNPQSLQANWRRIAGGFLNADAEGVTGLKRISDLRNFADTALNQSDVTRGEGIFAHDAQSELNRNQEEHTNTLRDNTSAIVRLSDSFANYSARNPITGQILGGLSGATGGQLLTRLGSIAPGAATGLGGIAAGGGVGGAAVVGAAAAAALAAGLGAGTLLKNGLEDADLSGINLGPLHGHKGGTGLAGGNRVSMWSGQGWKDLYEAATGGGEVVHANPLNSQHGIGTGGSPEAMMTALTEKLLRGLAGLHLTATVDVPTAQHAASAARASAPTTAHHP